ncbi:phage tail protein, partial [Oceanobacillus neutriphilus]|uniref:phage tail protein n=1 Tax=Oceanobacillus neutriphilus TaxID=531815 RepID=UPI001E61D773
MIKIDGQPSLFLLDLEGKEYPAIAEVNRKKRVNGQREISLSFLYDQINQDFIHDVDFGWKILFKGEWYTITGPSYALDGNKFSVGVDAVLSFFVDMNGHYLQDEVEDKSRTPADYFRELFEETGYSYVIIDNLSANTLNYQANQSKTERFIYGIDRFNAEYIIRGKVAYIYSLIGSDKDVILHEDLNIQDVSIDVEASGFHTWARGFGGKDDNEEDADYKLEVEEYIPALVEKYGWIEGPAIRDGSYKHETNMKSAIKKQIENSVKISTAVTAVDLTNNGYPEMQFEEGDRVWLYVTDLKQNQQVRVVEIDETFDWEGKIISAQYTLGDEGIAARYKTQQYDTIKDFKDIASGRKRLEYNWLPEAIQRASDIINGNLDSHFKYGAGEI